MTCRHESRRMRQSHSVRAHNHSCDVKRLLRFWLVLVAPWCDGVETFRESSRCVEPDFTDSERPLRTTGNLSMSISAKSFRPALSAGPISLVPRGTDRSTTRGGVGIGALAASTWQSPVEEIGQLKYCLHDEGCGLHGLGGGGQLHN